MTVPDESWREFIETHKADLLDSDDAARQNRIQPTPCDNLPRADHVWPAPHDSAFLARIDPWVVPAILVIITALVLLAITVKQ